MSPISEVRKPKPREALQFAQGHSAHKGQNQDTKATLGKATPCSNHNQGGRRLVGGPHGSGLFGNYRPGGGRPRRTGLLTAPARGGKEGPGGGRWRSLAVAEEGAFRGNLPSELTNTGGQLRARGLVRD